MTKALILDDERDICELIEMSLMGQDITCTSVYTIKAAIKALKEEHYSFIISDIRLPDGDGLDFLSHVQKHYPGTPVCMITAHGNMDTAITALKRGAFDFINKPFDLKQLRSVCKAALKEGHSQSGGASASPAAGGGKKTAPQGGGRSSNKYELIGDAEVMQKVRAMISKVARSQAPVFIHGESGTGKEVAARSIHHQSNRSEGAFVAVNCGAIPENLVESEFFGYKKGAFTGANQDQDGLFVAANGGTLFLDEVADLPLSMQVKLLRAIQERAVRRRRTTAGTRHHRPPAPSRRQRRLPRRSHCRPRTIPAAAKRRHRHPAAERPRKLHAGTGAQPPHQSTRRLQLQQNQSSRKTRHQLPRHALQTKKTGHRLRAYSKFSLPCRAKPAAGEGWGGGE